MADTVFISYAPAETSTADAVCQALEAAGVPCWIAPVRSARVGIRTEPRASPFRSPGVLGRSGARAQGERPTSRGTATLHFRKLVPTQHADRTVSGDKRYGAEALATRMALDSGSIRVIDKDLFEKKDENDLLASLGPLASCSGEAAAELKTVDLTELDESVAELLSSVEENKHGAELINPVNEAFEQALKKVGDGIENERAAAA